MVTGGEAVPSELPPRFHALLPAEPAQPLRPDRDDPLGDLLALPTRRPAAAGAPAHGPADRQRGDLPDRSRRRAAQPMPAGAPGEIAIGGVCLASGYLGRPEQTAERFVPPHMRRPGRARLSGRGSGARQAHPDGAPGRASIDRRPRALPADGAHRVPRTGRRAGEDARLPDRAGRDRGGAARSTRRSPRPRSSTARIGRRPTPGGLRGPGRVQDEIGTRWRRSPSPEELRAFLRSGCPPTWCPRRSCTSSALPLTPNGKVDRQALPRSSRARPWRGREAFAAPRTAGRGAAGRHLEELLRAAPAAGRPHDNFFALGGHSLLATQVIARVRDGLPGRAAAAAACSRRRPSPTWPRRSSARAGGASCRRSRRSAAAPTGRGTGAAFPLSFAQQRLWFLDQLEPGSAGLQHARRRAPAGPLDRAALRRSLERDRARATRRCARPSRLRRAAGPGDRAAAAGAAAAARPAALPAAEREAAARGSPAPRRGGRSTWRAARCCAPRCCGLRREEHVLLLTMHHIVADGWSIGVLVRELAALYAAALRRAQPSPPAGAADPVRRLRRLAARVAARRGARARSSPTGRSSWPAARPLELPTDRPRPAVQSFRGAPADPPSARGAGAPSSGALGRRQGATLFMTLLAAFQALLARYSGQDGHRRSARRSPAAPAPSSSA